MANNIILVTAPDDTNLDGVRICLVDLDISQSAVISNALKKYEGIYDIIAYVCKTSEDIGWLLDKKIKSDLIVFNAQSQNQTVVGYFAAHPNAYYFGDLRDLNRVNSRILYSEEDCLKILNFMIGRYERKLDQ
jgi:hypothetical protein